MNHDASHCLDYDPQVCPQNCYRAQLTAELQTRTDLVGIPMSWVHYHKSGSTECPRSPNFSSFLDIAAKRRQPVFASITFLPVCSKCGSVLWGEEVGVDEGLFDIEVGPSISMASSKLLCTDQKVFPGMCQRCHATFDCIAIPTRLPFTAPLKPRWDDGG